MKIVVFSDSHGNTANMQQVLEIERPHVVFHLGDGRRDIKLVMEQWPDVELFSVVGNCDWRSRGNTEQLVEVEGVRFLLSHGHYYGVKSGLQTYVTYGHNNHADVLLFGHTHEPCLWDDRDMILLNPGSVGAYGEPTYAVIQVKDGEVLDVRHKAVPDPVYEYGL